MACDDKTDGPRRSMIFLPSIFLSFFVSSGSAAIRVIRG
jgi:hypothetical protein